MKLLAILFLLNSVLAVENTPLPMEMNGYRLEQFGDFAKNWHFVAVRYRKDTGEMRMIYANDSAWSVMSKGRIDYPDGAVFAKVGIMTTEDPAFPNSVSPTGSRRIQFMVRDVKKHTETDGWGYALFDPEGHVFPGEARQVSQACAACHRLVNDRGQVFATPMALPNFASAQTNKSAVEFETTARAALPEDLQKLVPKNFAKVRSIVGPLTRNLFSGTLDEIRPLLATEAAKSKMPALLLAASRDMFSVVVPDADQRCGKKQTALTGTHTLPPPKKNFYEIKFCQDHHGE